jgi:hypothetical protein
MGLRDILKKHNIPLPADFDERVALLTRGLRRDPNFKRDLATYSRQRGGEAPEPPPLKVRDSEKGDDYLGPRVRWVKDAMASPYARTLLSAVFAVVFFLSYLENTPIVGSILSATLDLMLMGGKMLTKTVQTLLPPAMGMIPLPYTSMVGIGLAAVFGMIMWPLLAIVSLSRQDFATATESFIRIIPPPFGEMLANTFTEGNRTVARLDEKRVKLGSDISVALTQLAGIAEGISASAQAGLKSLAEQTADVAVKTSEKMSRARQALPAMPTVPTVPAVQGGFHRRTRRKAWRTRRTRTRSATH